MLRWMATRSQLMCIMRDMRAVNAENPAAIVASDGLRQLYAAVDGHVQSAAVQENGCRALWNIACCAAGKAALLAGSFAVPRHHTRQCTLALLTTRAGKAGLEVFCLA